MSQDPLSRKRRRRRESEIEAAPAELAEAADASDEAADDVVVEDTPTEDDDVQVEDAEAETVPPPPPPTAEPPVVEPAASSMSVLDEGGNELKGHLAVLKYYGAVTVLQFAELSKIGLANAPYAKACLDRYIADGLVSKKWSQSAARFSLTQAGLNQLDG